MDRRWYNIREASERLGVSYGAARRLVASGELPAIRVSKRIVRIPAPAIDVYASGRRPARRQVVIEVVDHGVAFGEGETLLHDAASR